MELHFSSTRLPWLRLKTRLESRSNALNQEISYTKAPKTFIGLRGQGLGVGALVWRAQEL